jgi:hypothetical protein
LWYSNTEQGFTGRLIRKKKKERERGRGCWARWIWPKNGSAARERGFERREEVAATLARGAHAILHARVGSRSNGAHAFVQLSPRHTQQPNPSYEEVAQGLT